MTLRRSPVLGLVCWLSLSAACGTEESGLSDLPPASGGQGGVNQSGSSGQAGATPGAGSGGTLSGGQAGTAGKGDSGGPSAGQGGAGNAQGGKAQGGNPSAGQAGQGGAGQTGAGQAGSPAAGQAGTGQGGSPAGGQAGQGGTAQGGAGTNQGGAGQTGAGQAGTGQAGAPAGGQAGSAQGGAGSAQGGMSGSSGQAGGPACDGKFAGACGACVEGNCCAQVAACGEVCQACLAGDAVAKNCAQNMPYQALLACAQQGCASDCYAEEKPVCDYPSQPPSQGSCAPPGDDFPCNPVTQAGCNEDDTCALNPQGKFQCYNGTGSEPACGYCGGGTTPPYCFRGSQCVDKECYRYCCDDSDCGGGHCNKDVFAPGKGKVGLCTAPDFAGTDTCLSDIHEPNNTAMDATVLPERNDCGGPSLAIGAVEPSDDQDWYTLHVNDVSNNGCTFSPRFELQGTGVDACYYFKCDGGLNPGGGVNCNGGQPSSAGGVAGCCVKGATLIKPSFYCGENQPRSGTVWMKVTSGSGAACTPYELRYGF